MRRLLVPLALTALLFSVACSDDDDGNDDAAQVETQDDATDDATDDTATDDTATDDTAAEEEDAPVVGDAGDYCDIVAALDAAESPEVDPNATPEEFEEAFREQLRGMGDEVQALRDAAPDEIRDDVDTVIQGLEEFLDGTSLDELSTDAEFTAASDRIDAFEEANCP